MTNKSSENQFFLCYRKINPKIVITAAGWSQEGNGDGKEEEQTEGDGNGEKLLTNTNKTQSPSLRQLSRFIERADLYLYSLEKQIESIPGLSEALNLAECKIEVPSMATLLSRSKISGNYYSFETGNDGVQNDLPLMSEEDQDAFLNQDLPLFIEDCLLTTETSYTEHMLLAIIKAVDIIFYTLNKRCISTKKRRDGKFNSASTTPTGRGGENEKKKCNWTFWQ